MQEYKPKLQLLSEDLDYLEEARRAAKTRRDEFAVKIAENTSKEERIGEEDPITEVELLVEEKVPKTWKDSFQALKYRSGKKARCPTHVETDHNRSQG